MSSAVDFAARRFDPANDTHYAISEEAELRLREVALGLESLSLLFNDGAAEIPEAYIAALFQMGSCAILGAIAHRVEVTAPARAAKGGRK